ncbi:MAG: hypothetical protein IJS22_02765 [Lachnospiraceae bacterium]|nr:hypothetical protein [Lachnospiraceae bacterium]
MRKAPVINWFEADIPGVRFADRKAPKEIIREDYFECRPMPISTQMGESEIVCGILEGWHHTPIFRTWETHRYAETFYYFEGTALMPFIGFKDGKPDPDLAVIVRIPAGIQVEVLAGVAHYVAVAENDHFACIVYSPDQPSDKFTTDEAVSGI